MPRKNSKQARQRSNNHDLNRFRGKGTKRVLTLSESLKTQKKSDKTPPGLKV